MQKGSINVTSENIFPIIKKFLYSDHDIFLREIISNAIDATQKLKTLSSVGEFKGELGDLSIRVSVDADKKTITVSDRGLGLTAEEVEKYINQIAFSGAEEFVEKYKDKAQGIIGHFGLGFYSSFMVSEKVELVSKSFKDGAKAVRWECDGTPEYNLEDADKQDRGTDIIMHIDEESKEFLEESKIQELLNKYCKFLPVEIAFGKQKDWKDGKQVETDKDNIVNTPNPLWTKAPADLKNEDYNEFYSTLYPMQDEPLFHIHLFVDYPFNLTGVLYFPKVKTNLELQKNKIQLYCNQVFVTDNVENIVPDYLTLLHGVIDSPDIPLNISRSYLQSDANVKKISSHISKKVADKLQDIFKNDRPDFESKWDSLRMFIQYGMLTDEKFFERAQKFTLLKNSDNKYFTFDEYKEIIKDNQTDKNDQLIYLYTTNAEEQHSFIEQAKAKGYDVLLLESQLDAHYVNLLEQKLEKARFVRVDSDVVTKLIQKDEHKSTVTTQEIEEISGIFEGQLPKNKGHFMVQAESLGETGEPAVITQSEFMRRMKEMAAVGGSGMNFYGEMPNSYNMVVNTDHPLIKKVLGEMKPAIQSDVDKVVNEVKNLDAELKSLEETNKGKKDEEIPQADKDKQAELGLKIADLNKQKREILNGFGLNNNYVKQVIDLALLANGMLKGEELTRFVKRSVEMIK